MPKGNLSRPNNRKEKQNIAANKRLKLPAKNSAGAFSAKLRQRARNVGAMSPILATRSEAAWRKRERIKKK
jgi:hypothetical protein